MAIQYGVLRSVTARDMVRALMQDGFFLRSQEGSHKRYQHPDGRRITVTYHRSSATFPPKTLKSMIERQAHWSEEDLRRLALLP